MKASRRPFVCAQCLVRRGPPAARRPFLATQQFRPSSSTSAPPPPDHGVRPTVAPKAVVNLRHIRENPELYEQNCVERNYKAQAGNPARINTLFEEWQARQREARGLRERSNLIRKELANPATLRDDESASGTGGDRAALLEEGKALKARLAVIEDAEARLTDEIDTLALALPNLTSDATPRGEEPEVLSYINDHPEPAPLASDRVWRSHVHIGAELGILDFAAAATASGWGWYYLLDEAAQLEQALVAYALAATTRAGWRQVSPPSVVYGHVAAACGFQPRDQHGEQQIYALAQTAADAARGRPELALAATAEIPLAGMRAAATVDAAELPLRRVAVSRCYRAESGARGADTRGLYRVREFTKVEMFAWTAAGEDEAAEVFDEMVDLQTELLGALGLHCRVLEMPTADLGASAARKNDIEAFFPSRRDRNDGWGEVTSASICTDYQTRRLATRLRLPSGKMTYPWTVNGTALAVPRVLAAILENGWDEADQSVVIPEVLRPWMDGQDRIRKRHR